MKRLPFFLQKQSVSFHGAFSVLRQCLENLAGSVELTTAAGGKQAIKVFGSISIIQERGSVTVEVKVKLSFLLSIIPLM